MFNPANEKELKEIIFNLTKDLGFSFLFCLELNKDDKLRGDSDSSSSEEFDSNDEEHFQHSL